MSKLRTVCLSNNYPPDPACGDFSASAFESIGKIATAREWTMRWFCAESDAHSTSESFSPTLTRMAGSSADARLWRGYRALSAHAVKTAESLATAARRGNALLFLDPEGLSSLEWLLALAQAKNPIPWIASGWPTRYPACDPFWTLARKKRFVLSPGTLIASALMRSLYGEIRPNPENFSGIRAAIFASETLESVCRDAFPHLEKSAVITPAVDEKLFPFTETSPERSRVWGWSGNFSETSGILAALDAFSRQAMGDPRMRLIFEGDDKTPPAAALRKRISCIPGLAERVVFAGKIPRERLAQDFFRHVGLFVFVPEDETAFPLKAAQAMTCGCLVFSSFTPETQALAGGETLTLFNARAPETVRMMSDLIMKISPEEWALIVADSAARIQEKCSPTRTEKALAEFIEETATLAELPPPGQKGVA